MKNKRFIDALKEAMEAVEEPYKIRDNYVENKMDAKFEYKVTIDGMTMGEYKIYCKLEEILREINNLNEGNFVCSID